LCTQLAVLKMRGKMAHLLFVELLFVRKAGMAFCRLAPQAVSGKAHRICVFTLHSKSYAFITARKSSGDLDWDVPFFQVKVLRYAPL